MRVLKYAWGLPVALGVLWLGSLLQGEEPSEQTQAQWQEQVNAKLEELATQQQALELQVRQVQQVRGPDLAGVIRDQTQRVTAELKNITNEIRRLGPRR